MNTANHSPITHFLVNGTESAIDRLREYAKANKWGEMGEISSRQISLVAPKNEFDLFWHKNDSSGLEVKHWKVMDFPIED
jgi:hypothetical protein